MFPEDFFDTMCPSGPLCQTSQHKFPLKVAHPKIITHPQTCKNKKITYTPIEEELVEESVTLNCPHTDSKKSVRCNLDMDIINDEQPSTSGSSNASNNSNKNSKSITKNISFLPICSEPSINTNDFYSCQNKAGNEEVDNDILFKETPHFIRNETEPQIPKQTKALTNRTKSANKIPAKSKDTNIPQLLKKQRPSTERSSSNAKKRNDSNVHKKRKKSMINSNVNLPKILPHTLVEKELNQLMNLLPDHYLEDPEVKSKLNILLKNIDEFKEVIEKKSYKKSYFNARPNTQVKKKNISYLERKNKSITKNNKKNCIIQPKKI